MVFKPFCAAFVIFRFLKKAFSDSQYSHPDNVWLLLELLQPLNSRVAFDFVLFWNYTLGSVTNSGDKLQNGLLKPQTSLKKERGDGTQ